MGDRALIIVTESVEEGSGTMPEVSPTVYTHWGGESVPGTLRDLWTLMEGRRGDVQYTAARLVGLEQYGNLSLGMWNTEDVVRWAVQKIQHPNATGRARSGATSILEDYSHGDAGVILFEADTGKWKRFGGFYGNPAGDASAPAEEDA